ncbi:MAG: HAMP domain-containing histidine kinase [Oscillospiraceae bacterium]|nr:HAMP domain-containing histidine kinase [Oscillospiraceae bacterium]
MIRRLRTRFILIASGVIVLIITVLMVLINVIVGINNYSEAMSILDFITANNGLMLFGGNEPKFAFRYTEELPYETRYFSLLADKSDNIVSSNYEHIAAISEEDAGTVYSMVKRSGREYGMMMIDKSTFMFRKKNVTGGELNRSYTARSYDYSATDSIDRFDENSTYTLYVFLDYTGRTYRMYYLRIFTVSLGLLVFLLFFILVSVFSNYAVKPYIENYDRQKMFITNAGHELKTPLAIISANTEVIEATEGSSEWTQSTLEQVDRLTKLVNELITLARLEEADSRDIGFEKVSVSENARKLSAQFEPVARKRNVALTSSIPDDIYARAQEKSVYELISILLDNGVKYCDEGGTVSIRAEYKKKHAVISVSNSYKDGKGVDYSRFFERFYRKDSSHTRKDKNTEGYGIGLSMAKSIAELNRGSIDVSYKNGEITFRVLLPKDM